MTAPRNCLSPERGAAAAQRWVNGRRLRDEGMIAGAPDLICIAPNGRTAWLEVKAPGGRLSERQAEFHSLLQRLGHRVAVVTEQDQAVARLREWGCIA